MIDVSFGAGQPTRLALIENDPTTRAFLKDTINTVYPKTKIMEAATVTEAVALIAEMDVDCIVTDHNLPDGTGLDLALQVACLIDDPVAPPIVMVTSDEQTSTTVNAMRVGIYDFILKSNLTPSTIQRAISHAIEKSQLQRANVAAHRALYLQAEELQRSNEALSQFAAVASHDLKEPLRTIGSFSCLLNKRCRDRLDDTDQEFLGFITDAVDRMNGLIEGLLQFAKVGQTAELSAVSLNEVAKDCLASLHQLIATNNAAINIGDLPNVEGDRRLITQLFQNLLTNAIKFHQDKRPTIKITAQRFGCNWQISVKDNGIGILPEHFERIFKIFSRLHIRDEYAGSGIGLSLCKRITEYHGGRISVQSEPGIGSTFTVELPAMEASPDRTQPNNSHDADRYAPEQRHKNSHAVAPAVTSRSEAFPVIHPIAKTV